MDFAPKLQRLRPGPRREGHCPRSAKFDLPLSTFWLRRSLAATNVKGHPCSGGSTGGHGALATPNETLPPGGLPFRLATKYALLRRVRPVPVGPQSPHTLLATPLPPSHQRLEPPLQPCTIKRQCTSFVSFAATVLRCDQMNICRCSAGRILRLFTEKRRRLAVNHTAIETFRSSINSTPPALRH